MEVTTKPIILDGDTGGLVEHFVYNVRTLERMGVSAVIIEDKTLFPFYTSQNSQNCTAVYISSMSVIISSQHGVNIVIYANQLTRSAFPAMQNTAVEILKNHRALEARILLQKFSMESCVCATSVPKREFFFNPVLSSIMTADTPMRSKVRTL